MKFSKKLQYSIIFMLYLSRAGRATIQSISASTGISSMFLHQLAVLLKKASLVKSVRGPGGGYELIGDPTLLQIMTAVSPLKLIKSREWQSLVSGGSEFRALALFADDLTSLIKPLIDQPVSVIMNDLVQLETMKLDRMSENVMEH